MPLPLSQLPDLPVTEALPMLVEALDGAGCAVLQAPPGAGKTTLVPLALAAGPALDGQRIIMLEPRRLAARAAAARMAHLLGEAVGETVGYRVRLDSRIGPRTRIEIVTDGIFTRMIQGDPELAGIGAVIFDEVHERGLETDLALALTLEARAALRPDLRVLAMSATLDAGATAAAMGGAPVISSAGRSFPVEIRHVPPPPPRSGVPPGAAQADAVADVICRALREEFGGVLVFLPGGGEIRRVARTLAARGLPDDVFVVALHGDLPQSEQDRALAPAPPGRRKVVLSTSIAETSLTIDGVRQVVDAGLARTSRYDPESGMTRLVTEKVSRAGADQRAGRAGRTEPGVCWRLWSEAAHRILAAQPTPEIAAADLAPLALELAVWGIRDPAALRLPDPPPPPAFAAARRLLEGLGAIDADGIATAHGRQMATLGLHPRLAHMILAARWSGDGWLACVIAALLGERDLPGLDRDADLVHRVELVLTGTARRDQAEILRRIRELARRWRRQVAIPGDETATPAATGRVLMQAYPDRIALARGGGRFLLSGGRGAWLPAELPLAASEFLAVADLDGQKPDARIRLAAPVSRTEVEAAWEDHITIAHGAEWSEARGTVSARRRRLLGALVLDEAPWPDPPAEILRAAMIEAVRRNGLGILPWTPSAEALRRRICFLAARDGGSAWPAMDDQGLLDSLEDWLGPVLDRPSALKTLDLDALLAARLDWPQRQTLDRRAPTHVAVPSGSRLPIDYSQQPPVLAVRVQELFGAAQTPAIDEGRVPLTLHLLSPAHRPIQVTSDLPGFWAGSYRAVRADLRGRYPRHPWPEDPLSAPPTARAKPRS